MQTTMSWSPFFLWGFVAAMIALTIWVLRSSGRPVWVVVCGAIGAAVVSYIIGIVALVALAG